MICSPGHTRRCAMPATPTRSWRPPATLLAEAMINTREAAEALRRYLDVLDIDPARQEEIERHAAALEALARKHRISVLELPAQLSRTRKQNWRSSTTLSKTWTSSSTSSPPSPEPTALPHSA